jgi:L-fuconolactonase
VVIKLSGLFGGSGSSIPATATELARVVRLVREVAGSERIIIGSDWPMIRGSASYAATLARLRALLAGWTDAELRAVLTDTAGRIYRPLSPAA